jgi:copper(I)-binding protein
MNCSSIIQEYQMKIIPSLASVAASAIFATFIAGVAHAQNVMVTDAWARANVHGQHSTGVFMKLASPAGGRLVRASSPASARAEIHEMRMENDVMKMRPLKGGLDIPAGTVVELKPGSYHLMLQDLKTDLAKDSMIALTLVFADAKGVETKTELTVPVLALAHGAQMPPMQ